jgi:hypothetical protein
MMMTRLKNHPSFLYRVSQDERELAKYGPSPFVGLNLVLENFEDDKDDNKNVVNDESDKDFNDDNVDSSNRIVRKGDRVWVIRQEKEVYRKVVKTS